MSLRTIAAALIGALAVGGAPLTASLATPATAAAAPSGGVVVRNAAQPTLTAIGRRGLLATAVHDGTLVARSARVGKGAPVWGRQVALGPIDRRYPAQVALNRRGVGAVAWSRRDRTHLGASSYVRLRSAAGAWSAAYRIPTSFSPVDGVSVNSRGTVAVLATAAGSPAVLAIHRPGGSWHVQRLSGIAEDVRSVAVASDDSIYLAGGLPERGAYGSTGVLARISPQGKMTATKLADDRVESLQVLATPDGHVDLVLGQAHTGANEWESTSDGSVYWATHYIVRSRLGATGTWKTLWERDGVVRPQATLNGNDVRLTWTQYADPIPSKTLDGFTYGLAPQRLELRTTEIGAAADDPDGSLLASQGMTTQPNEYGWPTFLASTAAAGRCLVVAWRTDASTRPSPLSSSFAGTTRTWADTGKVATYEPEAAAACVAGHGYLARTAAQVVRQGYGVSGKVRVEALG